MISLFSKGLCLTLFDFLIERLGFENGRGEKEFFQQLLVPLLAQAGRNNDEDPAFPFSPYLGKNDTGLDSLTQTNFISQDRSTGEWRSERKQGCINLMGIQVNLGISK